MTAGSPDAPADPVRVAILISGAGTNMAALVRSMTGDHPGRPVLVASDRADAAGLVLAASLGVPTMVLPPEGRASAIDAELTVAQADIVALAGYMRVLPAWLVSKWRMLNIHPSLLPRHPGLDTHARVLAAGEATSGCTVHWVTPDLDAGPILAQEKVLVQPGDTVDTLAARVREAEHRLYPATLRAVCALFNRGTAA